MRFCLLRVAGLQLMERTGRPLRAYASWVALAGEGAQSFPAGSTAPYDPPTTRPCMGKKAKPPLIHVARRLCCVRRQLFIPKNNGDEARQCIPDSCALLADSF